MVDSLDGGGGGARRGLGMDDGVPPSSASEKVGPRSGGGESSGRFCGTGRVRAGGDHCEPGQGFGPIAGTFLQGGAGEVQPADNLGQCERGGGDHRSGGNHPVGKPEFFGDVRVDDVSDWAR